MEEAGQKEYVLRMPFYQTLENASSCVGEELSGCLGEGSHTDGVEGRDSQGAWGNFGGDGHVCNLDMVMVTWYVHRSKLIKLYALNMCHLVYANYTRVSLFVYLFVLKKSAGDAEGGQPPLDYFIFTRHTSIERKLIEQGCLLVSCSWWGDCDVLM